MTNGPIDVDKKQSTDSGSPGEGEPEFLAVGKLRRPHGIRGDLVMEILTDFPERLRPGKPVFVGEQEHRPMKISKAHQHSGKLLIGLEGIETREQAGELRNQYVFILTRSAPRLPKGEYYHHELLGLKVLDEQGNTLGILAEILETRANDVYIIRSEDANDLLLPAVDNEVIIQVDLKRQEMIVRPPEWEST